MEDIEEGDEGAATKTKQFDDHPVLHFHEPGRVDEDTHPSSVMKDSQVAQLLQQQLDGWNFQDDSKHDGGDWNMNINGQGDLDTLQDSFQQKKADQRENFDTSYFSTYGSDYAPSMDNFTYATILSLSSSATFLY